MKWFIDNIEEKARKNTNFREVLETGENTQIVLMSIPVGEDIGEEVHENSDQILYLVEGEADVILEGVRKPFMELDMVLVRAGTKHNFINTGETDLKIITTYSPPHHPPGTIHRTKEDATGYKE